MNQGSLVLSTCLDVRACLVSDAALISTLRLQGYVDNGHSSS